MPTLEEQLAQLQAMQAPQATVAAPSAFAPTAAPSPAAFQAALGTPQATGIGSFLSPIYGAQALAEAKSAQQAKQEAEAASARAKSEAALAKELRGYAHEVSVEEKKAMAKAKAEAAKQAATVEQKDLDRATRIEAARIAAEARTTPRVTPTVPTAPKEVEIKMAKVFVKNNPELFKEAGVDIGTLFDTGVGDASAALAAEAKAIQAAEKAAGETVSSFPAALEQASRVMMSPEPVDETTPPPAAPPVLVDSPEKYAALPSGTTYVDSQGTVAIKP